MEKFFSEDRKYKDQKLTIFAMSEVKEILLYDSSSVFGITENKTDKMKQKIMYILRKYFAIALDYLKEMCYTKD